MSRKYTPESIQAFMNRKLKVERVRKNILVLLIIFVDVFLLILAVADPYEQLYADLLKPIIAVLNLFALYIVINPYKRQIAVHLYYGVFGIGSAFGFLIAAQKVVYSMMGVESPLFFILSTCALLLWIVFLYIRHFQKLENGYYQKLGNYGLTPRQLAVITGMAVIGVVIGNFVYDHVGDDSFKTGMCAGILLLIAFVLSMFSLSLHRYMLMLRHRDLIEFEERIVVKKSSSKGA